MNNKKELDCDNYKITVTSVASILNIEETKLLKMLSDFPSDLSEDELFEEIKKMKVMLNYDYLYVFHMTRLSNEMIENVRKNGLVDAVTAMDYIFKDIYNHFSNKINKSEYDILIKNIRDNYDELVRNPNEDNDLNALVVNDIDFEKYHFIRKFESPELVCDVIEEMKKQKSYFNEYHDYLRPYIIKIKIKENKEKYLKNAIYYLYLMLNNRKENFHEITVNFKNYESIIDIRKLEEN